MVRELMEHFVSTQIILLPEGGEVAASMEVLSKEARNDNESSLAETMRSLAPKVEGGGGATSKAAKAEAGSSVSSLDDVLSSVRSY